ncbi:MAG: anti-sigma factor antagonist, partial [Desulfamplus sp.]|nr:anti-sigma factor antagonist [Desulfamplus sp.]
MNVSSSLSDDGKILTIEVAGKLDITLYKGFSDAY